MANTYYPRVIIYTTPACSDCRTLKALLKTERIAYEEYDLSDPEIMEQARAEQARVRTGVRIAPITLAGEKVFCSTLPFSTTQ